MPGGGRSICVLPYRLGKAGLEILLARNEAAPTLIMGRALPRRPLHIEAQALAESKTRITGPVLKMPVGRLAMGDEVVLVFALQAVRSPEPDDVRLVWTLLERAACQVSSETAAILADLPDRIRMTTRARRAA